MIIYDSVETIRIVTPHIRVYDYDIYVFDDLLQHLDVSWSTISFFFSSRRRHTRFDCDWSSDVCSSDLAAERRISLPVAASSTYTNPVFPASTTAFLPPTMAITGGLTASRSHTSWGTSW